MSEPVCIAIIEESADIGGAEVNLLNLGRTLDRKKFRILVVVPWEGPLTEQLTTLGIEFLVVPRGRLLSTSFYCGAHKIFNPLAVAYDLLIFVPLVLRLCFVLRRENVAVVHTNSMLAHLYGALAARLAGTPCLWHMQDIIDAKFFGLVRGTMNWLGGLLPTRIVTVSASVAAMFHGRAATRTKVLYNGTDTLKFKPGPADPVLRGELGLNAGDLLIGIVGRLVRWKGHPEFLRAAAMVTAAVPQAKFIVVGETTFGPGNYGEELRALTRQFGLEEKVVFVGNRHDIPELMRSMDILVHASVTPEPFGLVITEAMASGRPVVASFLGGPAEIINNGVNGLLADPRAPSALAEAIVSLCRDQGLRHRMGMAGRQTVEERFSLTAFTEGLSANYTELISYR